MRSGSLTRRVIFLSSTWTAISIIFLGWLLLNQFSASAERSFADLQRTQLFSLIGAIELAEDNSLSGTPNFGDTRFLRPDSGWFWRVAKLDDPTEGLASRSIGDFQPDPPSNAVVPFDEQFSRTYTQQASSGLEIRIYETEIDLGSGVAALFQVGGNQSEFEAGLNDLAFRIGGLLLIFGVGVVAINGLILLIGLRPLDHIKKALEQIRLGAADRLEGQFPSEIEPMVSEMNVLIGKNRETVERARTQVGNLAHSLKTPLAVLTNEADRQKTVASDIVRTQTSSMQSQVQHYLSRARIAAQAGSLAHNTNVVEVADKLIGVMRKLNQDKRIELAAPDKKLRFSGEKEDFEEMLGNLVENACKWAEQTIRINISAVPTHNRLKVVIEDDGPGISPEQRAAALKRGKRLDETVPGTGLGLSIVEDTVLAYGGAVELSESSLGGLKVEVELPATSSLN